MIIIQNFYLVTQHYRSCECQVLRILTLDTRWRSEVSFTLTDLHLRKSPLFPLDNKEKVHHWPIFQPPHSILHHTRVYPKVSGLAAWSENCKRHSSLPLGAVISLFLWLSLVSFAAITLYVVSQWVFIVISVYFVTSLSVNFSMHPRTAYTTKIYLY
jgi:hypothetical protein